MNTIKCDVCGRFIPYDELDSGKAIHTMLTPDSEVSNETWETLCSRHYIIPTPPQPEVADGAE